MAKCARCVQKQKIQKNVRVEHCFSTRKKGRVAQIVHIDLAGPLSDTKEEFKNMLGIADNFLSFVIAVQIHWGFVNVASILSDKRKYHFESIYVLSSKSYPHSMESKILKFSWKHKILVCGLL